jgi:hypothetical protein
VSNSTETTIRLTGTAAIEIAEAADILLSKYADPIEDARDGLTVAEARKVASEDPGSVYLDVALTEDEIDALETAVVSGAFGVGADGNGYTRWRGEWIGADTAEAMVDTVEAARAKPKTEPLTDDMIRALRAEAAAAGDWQMSNTCGFALARSSAQAAARRRVADAINAARAMDDEIPFVRVVAR